MYRTPEHALSAFSRCLTLDQLPNLCDKDCPYSKPCGGSCTVILEDLREMLLALPDRPPLADKVIPVMEHCGELVPLEYCEQECPYYDRCGQSDFMPLLFDIRDVLTSAGLLRS